jgi:hypothetical protein
MHSYSSMKTNLIPCRLASQTQTLPVAYHKQIPICYTNQTLRTLKCIPGLAGFVAIIALTTSSVRAQCPVTELATGLRIAIGIAQSNQKNLLVSESGTRAPNTGRISIVDLSGNRRTLLDGLPSGINDVNTPSGPTGLFMRGRTLYVAIGAGDVAITGPFPGTTLPNPNPVSSPLFSSVLAIHFNASVEKNTQGLTLSLAHQQALANGKKVTLSNRARDSVTVELIADFSNFTPNPLPTLPANIRHSNPFDLVVVDNQAYVTDGGQNLVWRVDIPTGAISVLAAFAPVPNPFFNSTPPPPSVGGPFLDGVPTGIRYSEGQLLVTLFRGAPFAPGTSQVQAIDPQTGAQAPFITGLKTAIDVLPLREGDDSGYLVLQHASSGLFFDSPGHLLGFDSSDDSPTIIADCLSRPTSMTLDEQTDTLYVTELAGRVVAIPVTP